MGIVVYVRNDPVNLLDPMAKSGGGWVITAGLQGQNNEGEGQWMWFDEDLSWGPAELTPVVIITWDYEAEETYLVFTQSFTGGGVTGALPIVPVRIARTLVCRGCRLIRCIRKGMRFEKLGMLHFLLV